MVRHPKKYVIDARVYGFSASRGVNISDGGNEGGISEGDDEDMGNRSGIN